MCIGEKYVPDHDLNDNKLFSMIDILHTISEIHLLFHDKAQVHFLMMCCY